MQQNLVNHQVQVRDATANQLNTKPTNPNLGVAHGSVAFSLGVELNSLPLIFLNAKGYFNTVGVDNWAD